MKAKNLNAVALGKRRFIHMSKSEVSAYQSATSLAGWKLRRKARAAEVRAKRAKRG